MLGSTKTEKLDHESTDVLCLYVLGPPRVEWRTQPLVIARRQVRAVLYYLATRQRPVSTEHLRFLIWPDTPDSVSCRYLSHLLTHLRRALPVPDILITVGSQICLDPHKTWSDVLTFRRLVTRSPIPAGVPSLRQAVQLYRGPLLDSLLPPGAEFEHEIERERLELERQYLQTLRALFDEEVALGNYDAAIAYGHRYLSVDETDEEIHRLLMGLYAITGNRTSVLNQFKCLVEVLDRELGIDPLPDTLTLYQDVLQSISARRSGPGIEQVETNFRQGDAPLVGRKEILDRLVQVLGRVHRGQGGMALVSGETGIGKSRMLQECASRFGNGALFLTGTCYPGTQAIPYHPISQVSRQLLDLELAALDLKPELRVQASRLLPEFRALRPEEPDLPPGDLEAYDSFYEMLGRILLDLGSGPRTIGLCLDDLQWADQATLDWLSKVGCQIRGRRLLLLSTYCCKAVDGLEKLLHTWAGSSTFYGDFRLPGLDAKATLQLMRSVCGPVPGDESMAPRLHRETGGNPFYTLEVIRGFVQSGRGPGDRATWNDMRAPNTVWKAIMVRLSYLTPVARQTLEAAALLGYWFTFEQVQRAAGLSKAQTTAALDQLMHRYLLLEQGRSYRFQHNLIRLAVRMSLTPQLREWL